VRQHHNCGPAPDHEMHVVSAVEALTERVWNEHPYWLVGRYEKVEAW